MWPQIILGAVILHYIFQIILKWKTNQYSTANTAVLYIHINIWCPHLHTQSYTTASHRVLDPHIGNIWPWGAKEWTMKWVNRPTPTHTVCSCKPDGQFGLSQKKINHNTFCPPSDWVQSPCTVQNKHPAASCSAQSACHMQHVHWTYTVVHSKS